MRGWVTLLVTVAFVTSTWCKTRQSEDGSPYRSSDEEEKLFQISKSQEKTLKNFQHVNKAKKGQTGTIQSKSGFDIESSSEEKSSKESENKKHEKNGRKMWQNYARGKYGQEESVDLSFLKKKNNNKIRISHTKVAEITRRKEEMGKRKQTVKKSEEITKKTKVLESPKEKIKLKSASETEEEMTWLMSGSAAGKRKKYTDLNNKSRKKIKLKTSSEGQHTSREINRSTKESSYDLEKMSKHIKQDYDNSGIVEFLRGQAELDKMGQMETEKKRPVKPKPKLKKAESTMKEEQTQVKSTVKKKKTPTKSRGTKYNHKEESVDLSVLSEYTEEDLEGHTYESSKDDSESNQERSKSKVQEPENSEYKDIRSKEKRATKQKMRTPSNEYKDGTRKSKKKKNKAHTTQKVTTETKELRKNTTKKMSKEDKRSSEERDPLNMSTEELLRYNEIIDIRTSTIAHTELFRPTTSEPTGTDHWICPSDVKSQTLEIHWSNYDDDGNKRNKKPIDIKLRNNMKIFSTRELKGK